MSPIPRTMPENGASWEHKGACKPIHATAGTMYKGRNRTTYLSFLA